LSLEGKVAIVTGGSRGIGFETARLLGEKGATVVITSKNLSNLEKAGNKLANVFSIPGDVTKEQDVKHVIEKTVEKFGRLDIWLIMQAYFLK